MKKIAITLLATLLLSACSIEQEYWGSAYIQITNPTSRFNDYQMVLDGRGNFVSYVPYLVYRYDDKTRNTCDIVWCSSEIAQSIYQHSQETSIINYCFHNDYKVYFAKGWKLK